MTDFGAQSRFQAAKQVRRQAGNQRLLIQTCLQTPLHRHHQILHQTARSLEVRWCADPADCPKTYRRRSQFRHATPALGIGVESGLRGRCSMDSLLVRIRSFPPANRRPRR